MRRSSHAWILALAALLLAATVHADVLYDNGVSWDDGLRHQSGEGKRRSILDDFVVDAADGWSVTGAYIIVLWQSRRVGIGTDLELVFYADAGGAPDFDHVVATTTHRVYTEVIDHCEFLWCFAGAGVEFNAVRLPPGTYWVDMLVVGPEPCWQIVNSPITGGAVWVDYEDLGGRQPGRKIFGRDWDVNFILHGRVGTACPADLDGSGAVDIGDLLAILSSWGTPGGPADLDGNGIVDFGDLLIVLAAWGPCSA